MRRLAEGTSTVTTRFLQPESLARLIKSARITSSEVETRNYLQQFLAASSIEMVESVLNTNGIFAFSAARACIAEASGQINPVKPKGAIPKGALYCLPNSSVLSWGAV
ncbi:hypothetical protein GQR58_020372 [Nymphon striatum]|nr:hypothetical protein GQR58_020372 [Nymphon striatum]